MLCHIRIYIAPTQFAGVSPSAHRRLLGNKVVAGACAGGGGSVSANGKINNKNPKLGRWRWRWRTRGGDAGTAAVYNLLIINSRPNVRAHEHTHDFVVYYIRLTRARVCVCVI